MDHKSHIGLIAGFALLLTAAISRADEPKADTDDQKDIARLAAIWQDNATEIRSAQIRYRSVRRPSSAKPGRAEVIKLLEASDFVDSPDDVRLLSEAFGLGIPANRNAWGHGELRQSGSSIMTIRLYEGAPYCDEAWTDSGHVRFNRPNKQIDIWPRSRNNGDRKTIADFRVIPLIKDATPVTIENRSAEGIKLRIGHQQLVVEAATGFVKSMRQDSGSVSKEILQVGSVSHPGGIVLPVVVITCNYANDELILITIDVIESATLNHAIGDEAFAVAAPVGSHVTDYRLGDDAEGWLTVRRKEPILDILSFMDRRLVAHGKQLPPVASP